MDPIGYDGVKKKRGSIGLEIGKKGVNWIEYQNNEGQSDWAWRFEGVEDAEKAPNRIENLKNEGHHCGTSLPCPSMGFPPPPSLGVFSSIQWLTVIYLIH